MWSLRSKADLTLIFSMSQSTERSGLVLRLEGVPHLVREEPYARIYGILS